MWPYAAVRVKGSFFKQFSHGWAIELRKFVQNKVSFIGQLRWGWNCLGVKNAAERGHGVRWGCQSPYRGLHHLGGKGDCSHCPQARSQVLGWQIFSSPTKYSGHFCFTKVLFGSHSHITKIFGHSVLVTGHFKFSAIYLPSLTSAVSWVTTHQSHVACHTVRLMFDSSIIRVTELTFSYY